MASLTALAGWTGSGCVGAAWETASVQMGRRNSAGLISCTF